MPFNLYFHFLINDSKSDYMTNAALVQANFERNKNLKASGITILICALLFIVFYWIHWQQPQTPLPVADTGIEVNLGNSETGSGDVAPQLPGDPSKDAAANDNIAAPISQPNTQNQQINADPNETNDVPVINNPTTKTVVTKPNNTPQNVVKKTSTATIPTPPVPKPKAEMGKYSGGNGTGGNGADSYNGVTNQGIAGGKGDQGNPNGNPNSDSYTGNAAAGKSGVSIRSGLKGRKINKYPNFQDDFNEPGKVAVDITVDNNGNVTSATINPKGTTTTNTNMRGIAIRKAKELKLTAGEIDGETGTIVFNFKLRGE